MGKRKKSVGGKAKGYPTKWEKGRNCWVVKLKVTQRDREKGRNRWVVKWMVTQRNGKKEEFIG